MFCLHFIDINRFDIIIYKTLLFSFFVIFFIILSLFYLMGYVVAVRVSGNLKSNFLFVTVTHVTSTTNLHIKDVVLKESDMPLCCIMFELL